MKRILILTAILVFACSTDSEGNPCIYEPTLETNEVTDITETSATLNGVISIVSENCDVPNNTEQGFVYSTEIQPTLEDTQVNVNGTNISTTIDGLTPNTTYYVRAFLTNSLGEFYGNEIEFTTNEACDVVYLDDNGVTIKACPDANVGDVGVVNGTIYTVVDRAMLDQMIWNGGDVSTACVTRITDMSLMFADATSFNQPIGNWDVSSVTNMEHMFYSASDFNKNLNYWDVSNVINMNAMFSDATSFNQPIGNWDVSSVLSTNFMFFAATSFNQPIGDWDVNFYTMGYMFAYANSFNQPIGDWDVSNVCCMNSTFERANNFNQPIGAWDVSNVTTMFRMFHTAVSFNQDLDNWNVENVTACDTFSQGASAWTLPQPNFTNCNPN